MVKKCFVEYEDASSQTRPEYRGILYNEKNASMWTKRREGVFRLRLKNCNCGFRPQQSNSHMDGEVKLYYKVWTNMYNVVVSSQLQSFAK
jgi:hypothetical protein